MMYNKDMDSKKFVTASISDDFLDETDNKHSFGCSLPNNNLYITDIEHSFGNSFPNGNFYEADNVSPQNEAIKHCYPEISNTGYCIDTNKSKDEKRQINNKYDNIVMKEDGNMSIVMAQITEDGIVVLADSRSTKKVNNEIEFDDEYQKIIFSDKHKICVLQTGYNDFQGKKLKGMVYDAENSSSSKEDFIKVLNTSFLYYYYLYKVEMQVVYAFYDIFDGKSLPTIMTFSINDNGIQIVTNTHNIGSKVSFGIRWCNDFLLASELFYDKQAKNMANKLKELFAEMIDIDNRYKQISYIGGDVKTAILYSDGTAEWV